MSVHSDALSGAQSGSQSRVVQRLGYVLLIVLAVIAVGASAKVAVPYLRKPTAPKSAPVATIGADERRFGKRLLIEQMESHAVIDRLASGDIDSLYIDHRKVAKGVAKIELTARFVDGTWAPGVMRLIKHDGVWYVDTLTGVRRTRTTGVADNVNTEFYLGGEGDISLSDSEVDWELVDAMLKAQIENADCTAKVVDGTVTRLDLRRPNRGVGTVSIPVRMDEAKGFTSARAVLLPKIIEGREYYIIAGFHEEEGSPAESTKK